MKISVIVPFYYGNLYLPRLIKSIEDVEYITRKMSKYEIIIVNDSPKEVVELPSTYLDIKVINNIKNQGIQRSRIEGIRASIGDWILMLDQDDVLIPDGFTSQIELSKESDVIIGNGIYCLGKTNKKIFSNLEVMNYLIKEERFISIRNLIPSPGEVLIRKSIIPNEWFNNFLSTNGADDWFLWILLFKNNVPFICNSSLVYLHNDTEGNNLSADLRKMKQSSIEMANILYTLNKISKKEFKKLIHGIEFKYRQDSRQLNIFNIIKYFDSLCSNIIYRIVLNSLSYDRKENRYD